MENRLKDIVLTHKLYRTTLTIQLEITYFKSICNACYKLRLAVLNSEKHKTKSADHDLKENIEKWKAAISALNTDLLTRATLTTVNTVANHLLHQRVLIPISLRSVWRSMSVSTSGRSTSLAPGSLVQHLKCVCMPQETFIDWT